MLTPVIVVRPRTSRNVDSTDVAPMISGRNARKLANTNARITSAPSPPTMASTITLVPPLFAVAGACSRVMLRETGVPAGGRRGLDGSGDHRLDTARSVVAGRRQEGEREGRPSVPRDEGGVVG